MITICREKISCDDAPLLRALAKRFICKNFDDERIVFPNWEESAWLRLVRRVLRPWLIRHFNAKIIAYARQNQDVDLFAFKAPALRAETCRYLKERGGRIVVYNPDLSLHSPESNMSKVVPFIDVYISTKRDFDKNFLRNAGFQGQFVHVAPHYNSEIAFGAFSSIRIKDKVLGFLGNCSPKKRQTIQYLVEHTDWRIEIIGAGWAPEFGNRVRLWGPIYGATAFAIGRTWEVSLGLLQEANRHHPLGDEITVRSVEQPAAGMLMIHEDTPAIRELYRDTLVYFSDPPSMVEALHRIHGNGLAWQLAYRHRSNQLALGLGLGSEERAALIADMLSPHQDVDAGEKRRRHA